MSFASVYPLYVQKAEVDEVITWLTGYRGAELRSAIDAEVDLETFFAEAPRMDPNARLITGVVCGVRVELATGCPAAGPCLAAGRHAAITRPLLIAFRSSDAPHHDPFSRKA
jgi:hypothetical protein